MATKRIYSFGGGKAEGTKELRAYGRGVDLDQDGEITSTEGSSTALQPARNAAISSGVMIACTTTILPARALFGPGER